MSAHASAAALAARPAMAGKRISAKSVRCAFDRPSRAPFFSRDLCTFRRFSGRKRVRTSPPDPAALATRESHDAPPGATPRTWLYAHPFARASARKDPRATAPPPRSRPTRADDPLFPGSPGRSREPPSANRRDSRARTCAKRFFLARRSNRSEPLNRVAPLCLRPSLSSPSLLSPGPSLAPPRLLSASPRTLRTTFPTSPSSARRHQRGRRHRPPGHRARASSARRPGVAVQRPLRRRRLHGVHVQVRHRPRPKFLGEAKTSAAVDCASGEECPLGSP